MEFNTDLCFAEDSIEPCRACGIYFTHGLGLDQELVKPLFDTDDAASPTDMVEILEQMSAWKMHVARDDGRPQYMCISCIAEFRKLLKFKRSCLETQEQFGELELQREHNGVVIKREIEAEPDEKFCGFVYLDISDEEEISDEDGSRRVSAAFDIPHVPIKEEHMARVPIQSKTTFLPPEPKELGPSIESNFKEMESDKLNGMFCDDDFQEEEEEDVIIKFTYDDDDEAAATVPQPLVESQAVVSCKLCSYDSPNEEAHLEHMQRMHLLKDWECHYCAKKFTSAPESRIKFHMKWHKLQRHLKCPMCGFFCSSKETLKTHKKAVHTRTKCTFCGKNIRTNLMQRHLKTHLEDSTDQLNLLHQPEVDVETFSPTAVPIIPETTGSPEPLSPAESPLPLASTTPEEEDFCVSATTEDVPAEEESASALEPPAIVDSPEPDYSVNDICVVQCAFCSHTFDDTVQLGAHVLATHRKPKKRLHSPDKTPPSIKPAKVSKQEIENILPLATPTEETFAEDGNFNIIDGSLNGSSLYSEHKHQNDNNKPYSRCPICHKTFTLKFKLNRHMAKHKPPI
ncbi:zinc finger protein Pegasus [Drosophila serrata]|uniref:zinc finger protein Pegasus n=1 Tax=Drosophila serrata TaxID=7274 RepID=UPI000A1CF419|nr:zinc finger protein Pegasus [Drosophila serrata]